MPSFLSCCGWMLSPTCSICRRHHVLSLRFTCDIRTHTIPALETPYFFPQGSFTPGSRCRLYSQPIQLPPQDLIDSAILENGKRGEHLSCLVLLYGSFVQGRDAAEGASYEGTDQFSRYFRELSKRQESPKLRNISPETKEVFSKKPHNGFWELSMCNLLLSVFLYLMHPGHPRLDLGLNQPLELLTQEILHGDLVGLNLLEVFQQSGRRTNPQECE